MLHTIEESMELRERDSGFLSLSGTFLLSCLALYMLINISKTQFFHL